MAEAYSQDTDGSLRATIETKNLAIGLDEEKLRKITRQCSDGFEYDLRSRADWEDAAKEWTDLALQVREQKTWPWPKASNVKYPLLSTAAMQFNARAYPSLIPQSGKLVNAVVFGKDYNGEKASKAERVSKFMSYQVLEDMDGWEEDMDRLLIMLPIIGMMFKKTYYNTVRKQNVSCLIMPQNLVVNYWAKTLDDAERISEIIYLSRRHVKSRQMSGIFLDIELGEPVVQSDLQKAPPMNTEYKIDEATPYTFIEQHTFYDLDGDGYAEPYIVTFERSTKKVVRIVARFDEDGIKINEDSGKLQEICPIQYYTKFGFVPNPDGSFYDIGFGVLLGPLNESVNTLINQLIDAGTLSNMQAGFLGKGLKLKMGEHRFQPGEWKTINSTADDLKKQILPLPAKEPSDVLFQLMGTLVTSGKELASVAEIFVGKMPGQNTPATTTMATIEQGMKVFTAVYKRIYRSLKQELKKLGKLNYLYMDDEKYVQVLDEQVSREDFNNDSYDICPGADPNAMSQTEKLMKAQGLLELLPLGILDPVKVGMRVLTAQEQPNWEELILPQVAQTGQAMPPQDPKLQEMQMKGELEQKKVGLKAQETQQKMELESRSNEQKMAMESQMHAQEMQHKQEMAQIESATEVHKQRIFSAEAQATANQGLRQGEEMHQQKMQQMKQQGDLKKSQQKQTSKSGSKVK